MTILRKEWIYVFFIAIISFFLVSDLFLSSGQQATFDGRMHTTIIAQFTRAFREGEVRVTWADGFANYGMPMPLIHQQVTSYLGGFINLFIDNVILTTNVVYLLGAFLSCLFLYIFLRCYVDPESALLGVFLFNFTSYRIFNIYTRGALPEFFASVFLPLILFSLYMLVKKNKIYAFFLLTISFTLLALTHPFLVIIFSPLIIMYSTFLLYESKKRFLCLGLLGFAATISIGLASFYLLPLYKEAKYFYYGQSSIHLMPDQFLGVVNYISPHWYYFYQDSPLVRGNFISFGLIESLVLLAGVSFAIYCVFCKKIKGNIFIFVLLGIAFVLILLTLPIADGLYRHVSFLSNIQHPWRMLSALIFIPPILLAILVAQLPQRVRIGTIVSIIVVISFLRFPQIYTKNSMHITQADYYFTKDNVAAVVLNPIWTGLAEEYPRKPEKIGIIHGEGSISNKILKNSMRTFTINAKTPVELVDYTFYFPGWNVLVDNKPTTIEYQNPNYRGVITYSVAQGTHVIKEQFQNTKIRSLGVGISVISLLVFFILFFLQKTLLKITIYAFSRMLIKDS
ncbi:hypothetical protein BH11PAT1_BH11PAT1_4050 [soil metagenome]